jgi:general secretion pathway protein E
VPRCDPALPGARYRQPVSSHPVFDRVTLAQCLKREFTLLRHDDAVIGVFADPFDTARLAWIDDCLHGAPLYLVHADDLKAYLARHEESFHAVESLNAQSDAGSEIDNLQSLSLTSISEDSSVVVKLVNSTLYDALKMHASDIHLGTTGSGLVIKYRIDGVLNNISKIQGNEFAEQVISGQGHGRTGHRRKARAPGRSLQDRYQRPADRLSGVDHAEHFGEDAVLRVLDKQDLADKVCGVQLQALGFEDETLRQLRRLAAEPYGMVLVTGPTGSGKTTTLYAMITEINHGVDKIITIEDPVEYQLPGVLQIPVNEKKA